MAKRGKPGDQQAQRAWAEDLLRREAAGERLSRADRRQARRVVGEEWKPSVETRLQPFEAARDARLAAADAAFEATKARVQDETQEQREARQRQDEAEVAAEHASHKAKMAALQAELDALPEDD